jgi:hypothetical protein
MPCLFLFQAFPALGRASGALPGEIQAGSAAAGLSPVRPGTRRKAVNPDGLAPPSLPPPDRGEFNLQGGVYIHIYTGDPYTHVNRIK